MVIPRGATRKMVLATLSKTLDFDCAHFSKLLTLEKARCIAVNIAKLGNCCAGLEPDTHMPPLTLGPTELSTVVRLVPMVSIDLIVRNARGQVLLGLRINEPAKGFYFVPGSMIRKGERLREAFARTLKDETGLTADFATARLLGVYEHFYDKNRFGEAGYGTHYVVLGYAARVADVSALARDNQHSELGWWDEATLIASDSVHQNTKAYFR